MKRPLHLISSTSKSIEKAKKLTAFIDKKVFSKSGEYIGTVAEFMVHDNNITGMVVKGKQTFFVDKEFYSLNDEENIILKIDPVLSLIGKIVIDSDGRKIGKVKNLERKEGSNTFNHLLVSKNLYSKPLRIPRSEISVLRQNIILKTAYPDE